MLNLNDIKNKLGIFKRVCFQPDFGKSSLATQINENEINKV